jgi:hypothetical protein
LASLNDLLPLIGARTLTSRAICPPTLGTKAKLISECKAMGCNKTSDKKRKETNDNYYNNSRRNEFGKSVARTQKNDQNNYVIFLQELRAQLYT